MKPRMRELKHLPFLLRWCCYGYGIVRYGITAESAYREWKTRVLEISHGT